MEQHDPSRRQYEPYPPQQSQRQAGDQAPGQYGGSASVEPFQQPSFSQQSPMAAPPTGRRVGESQQMYDFAPRAQYSATPTLQSSTMQYAHDIQAQDPRTQQQQPQTYQPYGGSLMYGIPQPQPQQPMQRPYEQVQHFRQRPTATSETVSTPFGVPQTGQYYLAGQPGTAGVAAPDLSAQQIPSQYQPSGHPQPGHPAQQAYLGTMTGSSLSGPYSEYAQQPQYAAPQPTQSVDQAFNDYQARTRSIFTLVRDGSLREVSNLLLQISQYLVGNVEALGLTQDDDAMHDDRIMLWDEFNRTWLTALQCQFDLTQEMIQTNQPLREPLSIMSSHILEHLSRELVRMCDSVESHGLVDYQMGVAEEEIMDLLLKCLALLDPPDERPAEPDPQAESSTAASGRG